LLPTSDDDAENANARARLSTMQSKFLRTLLGECTCPPGFSKSVLSRFYLGLVVKRARRVADLVGVPAQEMHRELLSFLVTQPEAWRQSDKEVADAFVRCRGAGAGDGCR
jgi:hypothetical protein